MKTPEIKPINDRGFLIAEFKDRNGIACSIQESSIATEPCLWLGCDQGEHHHITGDCMARMHLTQEMAAALIPLLSRFVHRGSIAELAPEEQLANLERAFKESEELDIEEIKELREELKTARAQLDAAMRAVRTAELVYAIRDQVYRDPNSVHRALILLGFDLKRLAYTTGEQSSSQITQ